MPEHLIIDASRQPSQIRCLHCGFAQDLQLPMAIHKLTALERRINAEHRGCKPRIFYGPQFPPPPVGERAQVDADGRDPACVAAWPDCVDGAYDPRCCRFPKSCSCGP
jgi:hypothetical protein